MNDRPDGGSLTGPWQRRPADDASRIAQLVADATRQDGVAPLSGHVLDAVAAGTADCIVLPTDPGALDGATGLAVAISGDPAEVVVRPDARGHGFGSALVQAAIDRQGAVWAYGDLPAAAAVANRLGLHRGRVLLQMRLTTPPGVTRSEAPAGQEATAGQDPPTGRAPLPPGVRVRTFVPGQDEEAFLGVNARAFAWHPEQGRLDLAGLRSEMAQSWFDPAGFFLAVTADDTAGDGSDERVLGFHWTKVHPEDPNPGAGGDAGPIGEIYVLGVDPDAGIRGLGTPLTGIGLDHLRRAGLDTVMLYVEGDNDRARRLYERFGFTTYLTNVVYTRSAAESP